MVKLGSELKFDFLKFWIKLFNEPESKKLERYSECQRRNICQTFKFYNYLKYSQDPITEPVKVNDIDTSTLCYKLKFITCKGSL